MSTQNTLFISEMSADSGSEAVNRRSECSPALLCFMCVSAANWWEAAAAHVTSTTEQGAANGGLGSVPGLITHRHKGEGSAGREQQKGKYRIKDTRREGECEGMEAWPGCTLVCIHDEWQHNQLRAMEKPHSNHPFSYISPKAFIRRKYLWNCAALYKACSSHM